MKKLQLAKKMCIKQFDQSDFLTSQKIILDDLNKILDSFDYDQNLESSREYLCDLNGNIYINNAKVDIFVLYVCATPVSFAVCSQNKIDLIWTNYDFVKLGYATILLRLIAILLCDKNKYDFEMELSQDNLIYASLITSFSKVEGIKCLEERKKNGKILYKFNTKDINNKKILDEIQNYAI